MALYDILKEMRFLLPVLLFLVSCASFHSVPDDNNKKRAIDYCGGELWGYVLPLGPREDANFLDRKIDDPKPLLAVFMHMHSILEKDPEHSLTLHFAIRTKENLAIQFPERVFTVQIAGKEEKKFKMDLIVDEDALGIDALYPSTEYETKLVDQKSNQWQIAKRNSIVKFITAKPKTVALPISTVRKLTNEPVTVNFDDKKYRQIFVLGSSNIWPEKEPLKDTSIVVSLPGFVLNGATYPPQSLTFNTNYEKVKKIRPSYGRCPSTDEIFRNR